MTKKQMETKLYVDLFIQTNKRWPQIRELCEQFGLSSTASGWERLQRYKENLVYNKKCPLCLKDL